jgi:hypothetical protein
VPFFEKKKKSETFLSSGNFQIKINCINLEDPTDKVNDYSTGGPFLGVKRPGSEADHSLPSFVEVIECVKLYLHCPNKSS